MYERVEKSKENSFPTKRQESRAVANAVSQKRSGSESTFHFVDNRPEVIVQRKQQEMANSYSIQQQPIQRKGVKAELKDAETKFDDFEEETSNINWLRDEVATDIYNKYKPNPADASQHFKTKTNRDKTKGSMQETEALLRAKRLNHWADSAIVSAERIYLELKAAHLSALQIGQGGGAILMGQDTDKEPDVVINDTIALEVKHVDSDSQGSVDSHVAKGSKQLDKREYNENVKPKKAITEWQLHIGIKNPNNPWPYTPTQLDKLVHTGKTPSPVDIANQATSRIKKYEVCDQYVNYWIRSANPTIGEIKVRC